MNNLINKLTGCGTALVTPFSDGQIDWEAWERLLESQKAVDFLVPLGTTAETPCLTDEEKSTLLKVAVAHAEGRPVIAGAGTNSLTGTLANIDLLAPCNPDALLVVVP